MCVWFARSSTRTQQTTDNTQETDAKHGPELKTIAWFFAVWHFAVQDTPTQHSRHIKTQSNGTKTTQQTQSTKDKTNTHLPAVIHCTSPGFNTPELPVSLFCEFTCLLFVCLFLCLLCSVCVVCFVDGCLLVVCMRLFEFAYLYYLYASFVRSTQPLLSQILCLCQQITNTTPKQTQTNKQSKGKNKTTE